MGPLISISLYKLGPAWRFNKTASANDLVKPGNSISCITMVVRSHAVKENFESQRQHCICRTDISREFKSSKDVSSMRVYAVSDLHTDYSENLSWVNRIPEDIFRQDILVVAGDVAEKLQTFQITMTLLKQRFRHVFFIPGNHDLWCRDDGNKNVDSLQKLEKLLNICSNLGVETEPRIVNGVGIIPLYSWYHESFDKERDITGYRFPPLKLVCRDFSACKWPSPYSNSGDMLACYFDNLNESYLELVEEIQRSAQQVITFSHFLPRPELCPEKRMLYYPNLPKVIGSDFLEARMRRIHGKEGGVSACHVFGHTHFCWDTTLNGVRYIQAPLAYPNERKRRMNGGEKWLPSGLIIIVKISEIQTITSLHPGSIHCISQYIAEVPKTIHELHYAGYRIVLLN